MQVACQCNSCNGTGLYSGFAEPKGTAVICLGCDGKGWKYINYALFTGRKRLAGIKTINNSRGTFIATGVGAIGDNLTYDQFEKLIPDKPPK